ncbi:hypothetical protein F2Q68_00022492 [Brassica cretica]|uniref:Uncharacterized protein n=1 Tax=Brassica cretica TaxID=69181 RepID=A0A8S9FXN1_BRACR|nr:hypothetical protein F2Q68_00022492 [Brassica cretica]
MLGTTSPWVDRGWLHSLLIFCSLLFSLCSLISLHFSSLAASPVALHFAMFATPASLTFSTFSALLDKELDMGYKSGFMIAWILGGKGGILLTLCLTFASWLCGKASSSVVVVMVVAMWVGSNLARHAPLPQGALLTLLYMSIKLQVDSR